MAMKNARPRAHFLNGFAGSVAIAGILSLAAVSPGCGTSASAGGDGGGGADVAQCRPFLAINSDFANFTSWKIQFHPTTKIALAPDGGIDMVHGAGPRDIYINLGSPGQPPCPAAGATEFPSGTILVKVMPPQTAGGSSDVFAQVKYGCGFNASGAVGWEWWDLIAGTNGGSNTNPSALWNGATPPTSSQYGGNPMECNDCHTAMGSDNDNVISPELDLKDFPCK
jgi:hypothetical protein